MRLGQASLIAGRTDEALSLGRQAVEIAVAARGGGRTKPGRRFLIGRASWASARRDAAFTESELDLALGLHALRGPSAGRLLPDDVRRGSSPAAAKDRREINAPPPQLTPSSAWRRSARRR